VAGALAYRWDGRRCRLFFQTKSGSYNAPTLMSFLRSLKRHFHHRRVILLWDGLPAHRCPPMRAYLRSQRDWLRVESLPAYAPELNPLEPLWGNVKGRELAHRWVEDMDDVVTGLRSGLMRVRRGRLGFAFLKHAGLFL